MRQTDTRRCSACRTGAKSHIGAKGLYDVVQVFAVKKADALRRAPAALKALKPGGHSVDLLAEGLGPRADGSESRHPLSGDARDWTASGIERVH
jgi:hypothetical protein